MVKSQVIQDGLTVACKGASFYDVRLVLYKTSGFVAICSGLQSAQCCFQSPQIYLPIHALSCLFSYMDKIV